MNIERLTAKLVAAARNDAPSDKVPYAFEKRIMAGIRSRTAEDPWTVWGQWLWRSAMSFAAVAIACGVWSFGSPESQVAGDAGEADLSVQLEQSLYASAAEHADQIEETW
jgi:hypothetical protein